MHYEISSDRDVFVDAIGLLKAGETVRISDEEDSLFKILQDRTLAKANFPSYVKTTLILED